MTMNQTPPILLEFPDRFETDRLLVRMPKPGDGKELYQAIVESLEELKPWVHWAHRNQTEADVEQVIRHSIVQFLQRTDLRLLAFQKETGELAVNSGLFRINWSTRAFEIGYWVRSKYAGQGLVTELVGGLERFAIQELQANRIFMRCDARNVRSTKVPERLGYKLEGTLRGEELGVDGQPTHTQVYAKVRGHEFP
jgi:RimJ/RimL family protein N-acetyltransferase